MPDQMRNYDVVILGAGGAGLMCAAVAARRGRKVIALDHNEKLGKKILISGGGRCNFTNIHASASAYFSENPHFAKSALSRFTPENFLALIRKHGVPYHEKKLGQLFCDDSAQRIVDLLREECGEAGAEIALGCQIQTVEKENERFFVDTSLGIYSAESLVVATGGPSVPNIGSTDFGQRLARQFGHHITDLAPALVSFQMDKEFLKNFGDLAGVSVECEVMVKGGKFRENILFTHTGLSGPAILQASLYWFPGDEIEIDLIPKKDFAKALLAKKHSGARTTLKNSLGEFFTKRLADRLVNVFYGGDGPISELPDAKIRAFAKKLCHWRLKPFSTGGYGKAEVTRGGVDTKELSSKTMESKIVPGLYFIGEVVDVTGQLGGYNFQWAWASGASAGEAV